MFAIDCPRHASRVLVSPTRIRGLVNTGYGILLDVECWCGQHVQLLTGRRRALLSGAAVRPSAVPALAGGAHGSNL